MAVERLDVFRNFLLGSMRSGSDGIRHMLLWIRGAVELTRRCDYDTVRVVRLNADRKFIDGRIID